VARSWTDQLPGHVAAARAGVLTQGGPLEEGVLHGIGQRAPLLGVEFQHAPDEVEHLQPVFILAPFLRYEPLQLLHFSPAENISLEDVGQRCGEAINNKDN
jgi:hypothetical protein